MVKKKFEEEKQIKINELLRTLKEETHYLEFLNEINVKKQIVSLHFNENEIREWINSKKPKPNPNPNYNNQMPDPNPNPDDQEKIIQELFKRIDDEITISSIVSFEDFREKAIQYNYDYEQINEWAQTLF